MRRMVVVVPQMVHWTGEIDSGFTKLVQYDNKPEAYGFLRREARGWTMYVRGKNGTFSLDSLEAHNLCAALDKLKEDVIILMTPRDFVVFKHDVEPYSPVEVIRPHCLVATITSGPIAC